MKIVRDSAVRQEPAQPQAVSPEENRFSIRPRQIALFFLWMLAFTLLARGTSGALLPEVQLSTPAPNTITQSLTATGTIQWAAGSLFYLPEGLLVEAVFVSEGEAVQEGDKIAALRREDVEQKLRSLQAELAQKQTEYARLTKPVAADSYDLEKAQQALQAAYQAAENSAAAWAEKEANAGSERDALQRELNERQEPNAALDAITFRMLYNEINTQAKRKVCVMLLQHFVNFIGGNEEICVFNDGRLISRGKHDKLYDTCRIYKELYDAQQ